MKPRRFLYLHGFASSPASRKAQFLRHRFAERGQDLLIPDLTEGDFEGTTVTAQLRTIESEAGSGPLALVGSSLGGYLAALYAARHPEVERVVLLAPAFEFGRRWRESLGASALSEWERSGFLNVFHYGEGRELPLGYDFLRDGLGYEDYPDVSQPALVLHGARDTVVPSLVSEEFARLHPAARLILLDSDHELSDCQEKIWQETARFFGI